MRTNRAARAFANWRVRSGGVRTPTVLQMEAAECGAASLAMILAYYGRWVQLEELRKVCGVSRDGSKATNILKAARAYGLLAKGFKKEPDQLRELRLPVIIFWNFNHFVVLEGFGPDGFRLNDPAGGRRLVSQDEFNESFTGVVLTFEPGEEFLAGGRAPSAIRGLQERLSGSKLPILFAVIAAIALILPGMLAPVFTQIFVDYVLIQRLDGWLENLLLAMAAVTLLTASLVYLELTALARLQAHLSLSGAGKFVWHAMRLPVEYFAQRFAGEIAGRTGLNDNLAHLLAGELAATLINVFAVVFYAVVMVQYDLVLTAIGILFAAINFLTLGYVARTVAETSQKMQMDHLMLGSVTWSGFSDINNLKATGSENLFLSRWGGYHVKVANSEQLLGRVQIYLGALPAVLTALSSIAILTVGGARVMEGALSIGMLLGFQSLMALFSAPISQLLHFGTQIQVATADINRLDDVLGQTLDPSFTAEEKFLQAETTLPARVSGALRVQNLTYGYGPLDPPLIENFDLDLPAGCRVAFVGGSGSGKSTLGKIIAGMYFPWSGTVSLDGWPINELPRQTLRHSIGFVDQNVSLFPGTIRDNITMWDPTLTEDRIIAAAQDALIHDEITGRPQGYDYEITESGKDFSGGQRQRIILARALAMDPSIIIMDEATSALDAESEFLFMENLRRRGCSCLIIAHRLSTIRDCDEIILIERGVITERGRHDDLMLKGGQYRSLVES